MTPECLKDSETWSFTAEVEQLSPTLQQKEQMADALRLLAGLLIRRHKRVSAPQGAYPQPSESSENMPDFR